MAERLEKNGWLIIAAYVAFTAVQALLPNAATAIFIPVLLFAIAMWLLREDWLTYDWNDLKRGELWKIAYQAGFAALLLQAAANIVVQYGLNVKPPDIAVGFQAIPAASVVAVLFSAVNEELVFRKLIFGRLQGKLGFWGAALLSSVLFAVSHGNYSAYLGYVLVGIAWCWGYRRSGSIAVPIAAHMALNFLALIGMSFR